MVIGGGGREHAIAWKLSQSPKVEELWVIPGNDGIAKSINCFNISATDTDSLIGFAKERGIELTVVGPEIPLANGIVDKFTNAGLKIFGPTRKAAMLEASKVWAKKLMKEYGIPTASFEVFDSPDEAKEYLKSKDYPIVIKADGLAAGKGSIIAKNYMNATQSIDSIMTKRIFGDAGNRVVIEEMLYGQEVSLLAIVSGNKILPLIPAQDHKQIFNGDNGPNTGGMGAYAPCPIADKSLIEEVKNRVFIPLIRGLKEEGIEYKGIIYAGLMIDKEKNFNVLEFNVRFGDPETQAIMLLMKSDLLELIEECINGNLRDSIQWHEGFATDVVISAEGYPGKYRKGDIIEIDEEWFNEQNALEIFFSGVKEKDGALLTNGGRVLSIAAMGKDLISSINRAYEGIKHVRFKGMHFRKDIGRKGLM